MTGPEFEQNVRAVARALWHLPPGEGASELINNDEIDCVCRTEELIHLIECTTERTMSKFRTQVDKLIAAKRHLERQGETVKMRIVTLHEPTPQQRSGARQEGITAVSLQEFKRSLLDSQHYLEARWDYRFGSATDPDNGNYRLPEDEYVQQPLTPIGSSESYSVSDICDLLRQGRTVILVGPFGAGKSLTVREVFNRLRRDYYRNRTELTPIAINLRDHWGQPYVDEVLRRHANLVGFDNPYQLVRAWNAGQLLPILDGFDEISSPVMAMNQDAIRKSRAEALRVIKALMRDVQGKSGILLAGRDHYFDSMDEARELMNLPSDSIFIEVGEFSEEQAISFLKKKGVRQQLPTWLPRKPLLLGYLATKGLLEEVVSIEGIGGTALAWNEFLDRICRREAELSDIIDSDGVRQLLENLAMRVRVLSKGSGPLHDSDLADAYKTVTGYEALEAARTLLQRLPGLSARDQEVGARSFVDDDMLEALQAGPVARFVQNPYTPLGVGKLSYPLSEFSCSVVNHLATSMGVKPNQYSVAAREAIYRWSDATLALDSILSAVSGQPGDGSYDAQNLNISEGMADVIDLEDKPIRNLSLNDCMVNRVRFDSLGSGIRFKGCQIVRLEGISEARALPSCFEHCEIGEFDDRHTNAAIIRSELPDQLKVLLVIIRKLFLQRGSGRIDSALRRGVAGALQGYVEPVKEMLVSEGVIYSHVTGRQTIWHGNRTHRARMLQILERPTDSNDDLIQSVLQIGN